MPRLRLKNLDNGQLKQAGNVFLCTNMDENTSTRSETYIYSKYSSVPKEHCKNVLKLLAIYIRGGLGIQGKYTKPGIRP